MKNLFGAVAPTNRVLNSFKFLLLVVLVAIGFTSCKDQSKSEVTKETELIAKVHLQDAKSNFGIGGNQAPPIRICEIYSSKEISGGKNSNGGLEKTSDTGGRGNQGTTGEYYTYDIGGRNGTGTSTGGEYRSSEIGGRSTTGEYTTSDIGGRSTSTTGNFTLNDIGGRGTNTGTGEYSISDIGGRSSNPIGNYTLNDIEDKKDVRVIRRILEPFSADIGGRSTSGTGL